MERNNRPQGRETHVSGGGKEVRRRGEGLGSGPVGSGSRPSGGQSPKPGGNRPSGIGGGSFGGGNSGGGSARASGGRLNIIAIIAALLVLFGGGGGILSLLGGGGDDYDYDDSGSGLTEDYNPAPTLSGGFSGSGSGGSGTAQPSSTVAAGSREKYTRILGDGQDQITMMVYLCGTDLESKHGMATADLTEMAQATLNGKLRIIVYTGGCKQWKTGSISSSHNQIYEVSDGRLIQLENNDGDGAMTDPATLTRFIRYCASNYPANRYELILWDHGGGSVSGYGYDEKNSRSGSMSLAGLDKALSDAGVTFDFIGFDACLMATVENGLMLNSYADYMIASEETEPGIGWYYTDWVSALAANTSMDTVSLGKRIADDFVRTCGVKCRGQSATLSVVDLAELSNTTPGALKSFSQSLTGMISQNNYSGISSARNGAREFARSSKIDQIDLVDFAGNVGNAEGQTLAEALLGAVKYNRTSSDMAAGSYGLSIYFPYRKSSSVDSAVRTYSAIGMDSSYSECIRAFASLEVSGQAASGGTASPLPSLMGSLLGGGSSYGSSGSDLLGGLLGSFLGGDLSSIADLAGGSADFLFSDRVLSDAETADYIAGHSFDSAGLSWTGDSAGNTVISLPEDQWDLVMDIDQNLFYDDGTGYVDLGLDNVYSFTEAGDLLAPFTLSWLGVNGQPVAYYHTHDAEGEDGSVLSYGYIPVLLNGERAELLVELEHGYGTVTGARYVYAGGETDTVAKSVAELEEGDSIDFVCDYYSYDGAYLDSYLLGDSETWDENWQIDNVRLNGSASLTYRFTDLYQQHYWTEPLTMDEP